MKILFSDLKGVSILVVERSTLHVHIANGKGGRVLPTDTDRDRVWKWGTRRWSSISTLEMEPSMCILQMDWWPVVGGRWSVVGRRPPTTNPLLVSKFERIFFKYVLYFLFRKFAIYMIENKTYELNKIQTIINPKRNKIPKPYYGNKKC
jgi:hypothetical protein